MKSIPIRTGTAIFLTALVVSVGALGEERMRTLSGRVIDVGTGDPVARIALGVARVSKLGADRPEQQIRHEKVLRTKKDGSFEMRVPAQLEGLHQIVLWTASEVYRNQIHGGVQFEGQIPRLRDLEREGVNRIDLTKDRTGVTFELKSLASGRRNVMVPMRDGVKLATDIHLPDGDGPWPVLLSRTPYDKNGSGGAARVRRGYAVVKQDFRGRFASEGEIDLPFFNDGWGELQDGYDTIEWIAKQPWCNGKVGTAGGSALGITQIMTAGARPPSLVCQSIHVACGSLYHHAAWQGGIFRKALVEGGLTGNRFHSDCLDLMIEHPNYDDFWAQVDASTRSEVVNVPGFFHGGWFDVFNQGTIDAFTWRQYNGGEGARGRQKLLMGPWVHGRNRKPGELQFPANAVRVPKEGSEMRWFDYWLKGERNGIMDEPAVIYYVMGDVDDPRAPGNEWRSSDAWPILCEKRPYYLHFDGSLSPNKPPPDGEPRTYRYDPKKPVPTRGGCNLNLPKGTFDQRKVERRKDVLLYTTPPLREPVEITGRIKAILWAVSSCKDTDFMVKLTDVYPDGRSMLVLDGAIRARHRSSFEKDELLTPGEVYRFEIDLWSTSLIFNRGHRIRVAVSSSNHPRFDPNPNTGDAFRANKRTVVAENTIYHDAGRPSQVLLPVVAERR